jgi:hypothetical protein
VGRTITQELADLSLEIQNLNLKENPSSYSIKFDLPFQLSNRVNCEEFLAIAQNLLNLTYTCSR